MSVAYAWPPGCLKVCLLDGFIFFSVVPHGRHVVGSLFGSLGVRRRTRRGLGAQLIASVVSDQDLFEA